MQKLGTFSESRLAISSERSFGATQPFFDFRVVKRQKLLQLFACGGIDGSDGHPI
jgi:hypothetical protein